MANAGWRIGLHYNRSQDAAIELKSELENKGTKTALLRADLSTQSEMDELLEACSAEIGTPSLLINNASLFANDTLEEFTSETFDKHMAVNLRAPLLLSQAFAKSLGREIKGNIINITDQRVHNLKPSFYTYTLSKVALSAATITMAQALAPNIRVNAVAPGPVLQSIHQTKDEFEAECAGTPLNHGTTPDEIVAAIKFILESPALTGQTITLDGGQHIRT